MAIVPYAAACTCADVVQASKICMVYIYTNESLSSDAVLFLSDDRIGFLGTEGFSGWHGRYRRLQFEILLLELNYKGYRHKLRTTLPW